MCNRSLSLNKVYQSFKFLCWSFLLAGLYCKPFIIAVLFVYLYGLLDASISNSHILFTCLCNSYVVIMKKMDACIFLMLNGK